MKARAVRSQKPKTSKKKKKLTSREISLGGKSKDSASDGSAFSKEAEDEDESERTFELMGVSFAEKSAQARRPRWRTYLLHVGRLGSGRSAASQGTH
jgi:hypothetical protein